MKQAKHILYFLLALTSVVSFSSCTKTEERPEFNPERLFTPGRISIAAAETEAIITWNPSLFTEGQNVQYTVEIARDSTFQNIVHSEVVSLPTVTITDNILQPRLTYVARVRANAVTNSAASNWELSARFSITGEQIFKPVGNADVIDRAVILRWEIPNTVTKIVLTPVGGQSFDAAISAAESAAGEKIINNLTPNTTYTAEIYTGTRSRGFVTFTTKTPITGTSLIDLRGITGRPEVLQDTLVVIPDASTVILNRNEVYEISSTTNLSKSVTIMSGPDLTATKKAEIFMKSNFNITSASNIAYIDFKDVYLRSDSYSGKYVFNINTASTIGRLSFESSNIEIFRGVVRTQSQPVIITNFVVNDCIIDSISNYGVITVDVTSSRAENISITNSTIYKAEKIITSRSNSTTVIFSNNSVNEAPAANNYAIDYSQSASNNVTQGIKIHNNIFGIGKAGAAVRGIRVNSSTGIDASNNYVTADHVFTSNPIPNVIQYSGTSFQLWVDPTNGDFRFQDQGFPGRNTAGDPRWR